MLRLKPALDSL